MSVEMWNLQAFNLKKGLEKVASIISGFDLSFHVLRQASILMFGKRLPFLQKKGVS